MGENWQNCLLARGSVSEQKVTRIKNNGQKNNFQ